LQPVPDLIRRKRDGGRLDPAELEELVWRYTRGDVPDEQMAAFCMAVYFRGLTPAETWALTDAMVRSGTTVDFSSLGRVVVDKHSTGGVGDKTSIVLGPVIAACEVPFAKMSGRGLGHTGGTLDKLESIPGFRVELEPEAFVRQVRAVGLAIVGQTEGLVPADRRLYALRDLTATVDEISLIAASIMSKKIAAGADAILLDVKVGDGAFMKTREDARRLAGAMLEIGRQAGHRVVCELTAMDQPLGRAVGNALEIREAVATLRGEGPRDLVELTIRSAGALLAVSDLGVSAADGRRMAERAIASGAALGAYERWVTAQGGNPHEGALPAAPVVAVVAAREDGFVQTVDADGIGRATVRLGAGREHKGARIDHATGIVCLAKRGDRVDAGEPLAEVHARDPAAAERAAAAVAESYRVGAEAAAESPIVLETMEWNALAG
jgi:pyrimidine-nucleoside phosphorylase